MNIATTLYRSVLFVPAGEQRQLEKSSTIPADVLVFDLEDAVSPASKVQARKLLIDTLTATDFNHHQCVVRINGVSTPWFNDDMAALLELNDCAVMLPKFESIDDLIKLKQAQKGQNKQLFGLIETALGVLSIAELVKHLGADDLLCFGHVDFARDMGLVKADASSGAVYYARCQVALAAHAYRIPAIDNITLDVKDERIIRKDALEGMQLGFQGKLCIHPNQVSIVNEVYTPTANQVNRAREILEEWEHVKNQGRSVFTYENKMVDLPVVLAQKNLLARYAVITKNDDR